MGFLGSAATTEKFPPETVDPKWVQSSAGRWNRFVHLDPEAEGLSGKSGIFVIWHGGVKPQWLYVGKARDLAVSIHTMAENEELMYYEVRGRLWITWSLIKPEFQEGVLRFLHDRLNPIIETPNIENIDAAPIPVFPPAYQP